MRTYEWAEDAQLVNGAQKLCDDLSKFCRLTIVTNGISKTQRRRFGKSTIKKDFAALFISGDIGFQKPQTELFDYVFNSLHISDKSRVLMVGDNLATDILGGIHAGIDTCWFNHNEAVNETKIKVNFEIQSLSELRKIVFPEPIR
ncbi:MAG: HAD-IA family hydrolase [Sporolactobacillus sp.]